MKYIVFLIIALVTLFAGCISPKQPTAKPTAINLDSLNNLLKETDLDFSDLSVKEGFNKAFIAYAAGNATLLRRNHMPVVGRDSLYVNINSEPDSTYTLTWQPLFADIAASGDLGYTYGRFLLKEKRSGEEAEGTYCTIWKRQGDGSWKYVLDTGNSGLKPAK